MINRRSLIQASIQASIAGTSGLLTSRSSFAASAQQQDPNQDRILVVVELSGGNDGLNTVVPFRDDAYYRHRPTIGIPQDQLLSLDEDYGLNPGALGFQRLWNDGQLAIVHGCGYEQPSYSHFTSMAYWHTAAPNRGNEFGWVGRVADAIAPTPQPNVLINIDSTQSLAVKSRVHTPVVFDDPERFQRDASRRERAFLDSIGTPPETTNAAQRYVNEVAVSARAASRLVRDAWSGYQSPIDYGIAPIDLPKVAACIAHGLPTRLYYVAFRNNSFDTHVQQPALHQRLLSYACDGIYGFLADMERIGQADRVVVLVFSEFGRRVGENANLGTDHGSANVMFLAGKPVRGGHYGETPSLTELNAEDNLLHTVDFRRVYATAIDGWLKPNASAGVLQGDFEIFPAFNETV
jgi:uncharacterized protein (DUF1501 family)